MNHLIIFLTVATLTIWSAIGLANYDFGKNNFYEETKGQMILRHIAYGPVAWGAMTLVYLYKTAYKALGK